MFRPPMPCYILPVRENNELFAETSLPWLSGRRAGVDEVGIGPLAGPVVAAAVLLHPDRPIDGLTDSKALTARRRDELALMIKQEALAWAVAEASVAEIDSMNILRASHLAMQRALAKLAVAPASVLVDGNKAPALDLPVVTIVKGDALVPQIGAASILAKVYRDTLMGEMDVRYPGYDFAKHKGYPTRAHMQALNNQGASALHRRSFAPVQAVLPGAQAAAQQTDLAEVAL